MALSIAFEDVKADQYRNKRGDVLLTPFFGSRDTPDLPSAKLSQHEPACVSHPHFHIVDQFQVVVGGKGRIGRHDLVPYCVHFSRAYTPYGPLVADAGTPLIFFGLRPRYDPGSQHLHLPQALDRLKQAPDRRPWQITRPAIFSTLSSRVSGADIVLQAVPDIKDDHGLAAYTLSMKPNTQASAPDPAGGDGQYLVVVRGSLWHDHQERQAPALVFVYSKEGAFQIHAGLAGLEAIILNFPRSQTRATQSATSVRIKTGLKVWKCTLCEFVYDEAAGLPEDGIAPGTRWQDVPEAWTCPDCGSPKGDFQMMELGD